MSLRLIGLDSRIVSLIASAVEGRIAVEDFAIETTARQPNFILADNGSEVAANDDEVVWIASFSDVAKGTFTATLS